MGRKRYEKRGQARERWPLLSNMLACYFNQDFAILYGSVEQAMALAVAEGDLDYRRAILKEWRDWHAAEGAADDIRPFLDDSFSVDVLFKSPEEARHFMKRLYDALMDTVRAETQPSTRRPS